MNLSFMKTYRELLDSIQVDPKGEVCSIVYPELDDWVPGGFNTG